MAIIRRIPRLIATTLFLLPAATTLTANTCVTCYIDYVNGSDSNDGTAKNTGGGHGPWKHAPGMLGLSPTGSSTGDACASTCAAQVPKAGDSYILKGGEVWPYTVQPWNFTWGGTSSTTTTYGCAGTGCIYIGYDPTWNAGVVNAITLNRDLGGCTSAPTVSFSGGGGSNAAATAVIMPLAVSIVQGGAYGFVTSFRITNQGSGYTSNPTVTVTGGGCTNVQAVADIYRPVIDAGLISGIVWSVGFGPGNTIRGPGLFLTGMYTIVDHLEVRNILQAARACGVNCSNNPDGFTTAFLNDHSSGHVTFSGNYIHGRVTSCNAGCSSQEAGDVAILTEATDESANNYITNGDQMILGNGLTDCALSSPCSFSEHSIKGAGYIHGNRIYLTRWFTHVSVNPGTVEINNNEMWLAISDVASSAHINEMYSLVVSGTLYEYNNIYHNAVSGASNQQEMGNGTTQYFFNNVSWGLGGGTPNYGLDPNFGAGASGGAFYFYNNTMQADYSTAPCINSGTGPYNSALTVVMQNNHCISNQNPYWINNASGSTWENQAGSTTNSSVQAASQLDAYSQATYTVAHLFAPTGSGNDTVTFAGGSGTSNLTSLCSGVLVALCFDINGNARPSTGGWQAGAYAYNQPAPPTSVSGLVK